MLSSLALCISRPNRRWALAGLLAAPVSLALFVRWFELDRWVVNESTNTFTIGHLALAATAITMVTLISLSALTRMIAVSAPVSNAGDPHAFCWARLPDFISQKHDS